MALISGTVASAVASAKARPDTIAAIHQFRSSDLALAAYNGGPARSPRRAGLTVRYVANVTALWRELRGCH